MNFVRHYQVKYFSAFESMNIKPNAEVTVLRELKTSSKVLKQEKRGKEMKIARLGRFFLSFRLSPPFLFVNQKPSQGQRPHQFLTVTQPLAKLHPTHAWLLGEYDSTAALPRSQGADGADVKQRKKEGWQAMEMLKADARSLKEQSRVNGSRFGRMRGLVLAGVVHH
jgi:hypothetical protein